MSARLTTLFRKAKSDLSEGGTNTLFLATGFLRWKKTADDDQVYRAPLLLLPVKLNRRSARSDFYLTHHEDDPRINATLLQFLERDFGIKIPALQSELPTDHAGVDLPRIFEILRDAVRDVPGFEIVEDTALSTFSFAKFLMWKDLVDRVDNLRDNRLVRHLIDNPDTPFVEDDNGLMEPSQIDQHVAPADLLTPLPADSSQLCAVLAAADGHDFVVVGPPGTGKSQTIANMIAHCLAKGKTVLFVAEKSAALDVVYRRLKAYGLEEACVELHSNKSDRRQVLAQLGNAWDRAADQSQKEWVRVTSDLLVHRDKLNAYVDDLHRPGTHGYSVFDAIGYVIDKTAGFSLKFPALDAHDDKSFLDLRSLAEVAGRSYEAIGECRHLHAIAHPNWSFAWQSELFERMDTLATATQALTDRSENLEQALGLIRDPDKAAERLELLSRFANVSERTAAKDFTVALDADFARFDAELVELEQTIASIQAARSQVRADYADDEIARMPLDDLDREWREASIKFWPLSFFAKRRVGKLLQTYARSGNADPSTDIAQLRILQSGLASVARSLLAGLPAFRGVETDTQQIRDFLGDAADLRDVITEVGKVSDGATTTRDTLIALVGAGGDKQPATQAARSFAETKATYDRALAGFCEHTGQDIGSIVPGGIAKPNDWDSHREIPHTGLDKMVLKFETALQNAG